MSEETIITDQAGEEDLNESARVNQESETSRRLFLQRAMAVASGLALTSMLPGIAREFWVAEAQANCDPAAPGQPLQSIMEIKTGPSKILKAVIKVLDEKKVYLGSPPAGTSLATPVEIAGGIDGRAGHRPLRDARWSTAFEHSTSRPPQRPPCCGHTH